MEYYNLPQTNLKVSKVALGCMRIASKTPEEVENLVLESLKAGINFFDRSLILTNLILEHLTKNMILLFAVIHLAG